VIPASALLSMRSSKLVGLVAILAVFVFGVSADVPIDQCLEGDCASDDVGLLHIAVSEAFGRFEALSSSQGADEGCHLSGTWNDGRGRVTFSTNETSVQLVADNLPAVSLTHGEDVSEASMDGFRLLAKSSVASGRGKKLSSLLGEKGFNGHSWPCTQKLHMLLLTLAKASDQQSRPATMMQWEPYGYDAECPSGLPSDWECQVEKTIGSDSEWVAPGSDLLKGYKLSLNGDIKCRSSTNQGCYGLCGKGCDCWESICGSDYLCEYNPVCCAHDHACTASYRSKACLAVSTVYASCSNEGLKILGK